MLQTELIVEERALSPEEAARAEEQHERHRRNDNVLQERIRRDRDDYRGKVVVVAGQELYAAQTAEEAWAWAHEHHPDDDAPVVQYVTRERGWRIYGNRWRVV